MNTGQQNDLFHPALEYNKKFYKTLFMRAILKTSNKILDKFDAWHDKKICGFSLVKYVPSSFRDSKGATGSQATRYCVLDEIFNGEHFSDNDNFMDIGCGKARVIAYLIKNNFPGKLNGIELNEDVANLAKNWTKKYNDVSIIYGDAFEQNFNAYNIFFFGRPFETKFFEKFINKFEKELTHPVKVFYWVDQQSGNYLNDRTGWKLHKRSWIFKKHGFYVAYSPQRYSIWTYTPQSCINIDDNNEVH